MNRLIRYVVSFFGHDDTVGYNAGLGNKEARSYALYTALHYGGRVTAEHTDGTTEVIRDYARTHSHSPKPAAESV